MINLGNRFFKKICFYFISLPLPVYVCARVCVYGKVTKKEDFEYLY